MAILEGGTVLKCFVKELRFKEFTVEIINYEEKEMIPLTDEEKEFYEKQNLCHICKKKILF